MLLYSYAEITHMKADSLEVDTNCLQHVLYSYAFEV